MPELILGLLFSQFQGRHKPKHQKMILEKLQLIPELVPETYLTRELLLWLFCAYNFTLRMKSRGKMMAYYPTYKELSLNLAWEFTEILPGSIERNRKDSAGLEFPIIGPLPLAGYQTQAIENALAKPPYLYAVYNGVGDIKYIGVGTSKTLKTVLQRWIRPDKNSGSHYWAHGTNKKKATITAIAEDLAKGIKPIRLYFANYERLFPLVENRGNALGYDVREISELQPETFIDNLEQFMIHRMQPEWNIWGKRKLPVGPIAIYGNYWE